MSELFSFGHISIAFTDTVDDLISFEYDAETPAFSLFFKLLTGNIDDHVLKVVNKDDLTFDGIGIKGRPEMAFFHIGYIGYTNVLDGFPFHQLVDHITHNRSKESGVLDRCFFQWYPDNDLRCFFEDHRQ